MQGCRCMKPFKHLKPGMSFIEIVAAMAILAIFGSSLFFMQAFLFERITMSQRILTAKLRMQTELIAYRIEILKELFAFKGPVTESLKEKTKNFEYPDMVVTIKAKSDFKETKFKDFKDLYIITTRAQHEDRVYGSSYTFIHIPKVPKK